MTELTRSGHALSPDARTILLVDPNPVSRAKVEAVLLGTGYRVATGAGLEATADPKDTAGYDAIIVSMDWKEDETAAKLDLLRRRVGSMPLLLLCAADRVQLAVAALRQGADDYLLGPPDSYELRARLERILEHRDLDSRVAFFQNELSKRSGFRGIEGRSSSMRAVLERVLRVAPMRSTVLVQGESGVGKELVARSMHFNSQRRNGPFIALNCAAMSANLIESELFGHEKGSFTGAHSRVRGKFEIAHRGTLFLDEIGDMAPGTQAKLLRVLEEREFMRVGGDRSIRVDVRVIAATNADLDALVSSGQFRRDLYYRLKVVTILVPPLRERRADIPALVETFLDQLSRANAVKRKSISPAALAVLQTHQWPGNVRELKNTLESLLVSAPGEVIRVEDLPSPVRNRRGSVDASDLAPGTSLADMERQLIHRTLEYTGGNRTHSADLLGIGVRTLQRKIRTYGISIPPRRRRPRRDRKQDEAASAT